MGKLLIPLVKSGSGGGGRVVPPDPITITENGTYEKESGGYSPVNVQVPSDATFGITYQIEDSLKKTIELNGELKLVYEIVS